MSTCSHGTPSHMGCMQCTSQAMTDFRKPQYDKSRSPNHKRPMYLGLEDYRCIRDLLEDIASDQLDPFEVSLLRKVRTIIEKIEAVQRRNSKG